MQNDKLSLVYCKDEQTLMSGKAEIVRGHRAVAGITRPINCKDVTYLSEYLETDLKQNVCSHGPVKLPSDLRKTMLIFDVELH